MAILTDVEKGRAFDRVNEAEEYVFEPPARGAPQRAAGRSFVSALQARELPRDVSAALLR